MALLDGIENNCSARTGESVDQWWSDWGRTPGCGARTLYRVRDGVMDLRPALCGMWSCSVCGPQRYKWFVSECEVAMVDKRLKYFWTLTLRFEGDGWGSASKLTRAWAAFRLLLFKRDVHLSYIWCMEFTERGQAHLHVFWDQWLAHELVSRLWTQATGGSYVVWVEQLGDMSVAGYVAKYAVKEHRRRRQEFGEWVARGQCYGKSRDIQFRPYRGIGGKGWETSRMPYAGVVLVAREFFDLVREPRTERTGCEVRLEPDRIGVINTWRSPVGHVVRKSE